MNTYARWTGFVLQAVVFSMIAWSASAQTSPSTPSNWTGFYLGGGVSYQRDQLSSGHATFATQQSSSSPVVSGSFTPQATEHKFNGQVFTGYRAQLNSFVGGLEASLNLNSTTKIARLPTLVCGSPTDPRPTNACVAAAPYGTLRDYGRVRATGGYLVSPNLLAFLSAGAVFGHGNPFGFAAGVNTDNGTTAAAASVNLSHTQKDVIGWTLGGGLEGKINDHLSLRMEYIYDRFPSISTQTVNISGTATPPSGSMATISAINSGSARFSQQSTMISLVYSY